MNCVFFQCFSEILRNKPVQSTDLNWKYSIYFFTVDHRNTEFRTLKERRKTFLLKIGPFQSLTKMTRIKYFLVHSYYLFPRVFYPRKIQLAVFVSLIRSNKIYIFKATVILFHCTQQQCGGGLKI